MGGNWKNLQAQSGYKLLHIWGSHAKSLRKQ